MTGSGAQRNEAAVLCYWVAPGVGVTVVPGTAGAVGARDGAGTVAGGLGVRPGAGVTGAAPGAGVGVPGMVMVVSRKTPPAPTLPSTLVSDRKSTRLNSSH